MALLSGVGSPPIKFSYIENEFGSNPTRSMGAYRVSETIGGLSVPTIGWTESKANPIPNSGTIKFSDFYGKMAITVVDLHSGSATTRKSVRGQFNSGNVRVVGGFGSINTSDTAANNTTTGTVRGKYVIGRVNKTIGSVKRDNDKSRVALRTGDWDINTELEINIGSDGKLFGAGGDGGNAGHGNSPKGSGGAGVDNNAPNNATSALGVEYFSSNDTTVINSGYIQTGYGGGGGGGHAAKNPDKKNCDPSQGGSGGGGGAGYPNGSGGAPSTSGLGGNTGNNSTNTIHGNGGTAVAREACNTTTTGGAGGDGGDPNQSAQQGGNSSGSYGGQDEANGGNYGWDGDAIRVVDGSGFGVNCIFTATNSQSPYSTGSVWSHNNSPPNNNAGDITSGPDVFGLGGTQQTSQSINCDSSTTINGIVTSDPISNVTWTDHNIVETAWVYSRLGGGNASTPNWSQFLVDYGMYPSNTDVLVTTSPHIATWYSFLAAGNYTIDFQVDNTATVYWNGAIIGSNGSSPHNTTTTLTLPVPNSNSHNFLTIFVSNVDNGGGWATNPAGLAFELKNPSGTVIQRSNDAFPTLTQQYAAYGWGTLLQNYNVFPLDTSALVGPRKTFNNQWQTTNYAISVSNAGNVTVEAAVSGEATFKWNGTTIGSTTNRSTSDTFTVSNVPAGTHILNVQTRTVSNNNDIGQFWYLNPGGVAFVVRDATNNTIKTSRNTGSQPSSPRARIQLANNNRTIQCEDTPIGGDNDYDDLVINCTSGEFSITSATDPATFLWTAPNTAGGGLNIINNGTIHGNTVYNSTVS